MEIGWLSIPGFGWRRLVRVIRDEAGDVIGYGYSDGPHIAWSARSYPGAIFTRIEVLDG